MYSSYKYINGKLVLHKECIATNIILLFCSVKIMYATHYHIRLIIYLNYLRFNCKAKL